MNHPTEFDRLPTSPILESRPWYVSHTDLNSIPVYSGFKVDGFR